MAHWNYRLMRNRPDDDLFLTEVHYTDDGTPKALVAEGATFVGADPDEVREALRLAQAAMDLPVLTPEDFPGGLR